MQRNKAIEQLKQKFDVIIIGGGATGLGIAVDAATRGYKTLLLEGKDFGKGTSSRSTKLVHGGVRYLAQGDVALVREALRERGRLANNAPQLFKTQAFIIPGEKWWTGKYYTFGLWIYDRLSGALSIGRTKHLSGEETQKRLQNVKKELLRDGVCYYDGQFDDARLAITLAQTAHDHGATLINYCPVTALEKNEQGQIIGVKAHDEINNKDYQIEGKVIINATGVFANAILNMDQPSDKPHLIPSQGIHLVLDKKFLPGDDALMVPKTSDGRVLFAVPWHGKVVVGTTDTLVKNADYEPKPLEEEIDFILNTAKHYLEEAPTREDVRSVFVGLRPLAAPKEEGKSTKEVSRSHKVEISPSGLVNIFGGKWTTYRQMAEDTLDAAIKNAQLEQKACQSTNLKLHGYQAGGELDKNNDHLSVYGSDAEKVRALGEQHPELQKAIHPKYPYNYAQIKWAIDEEYAFTIEDVLARRTRLLFLDAKAAIESASAVADFMAEELKWSEEEKSKQLEDFLNIAKGYCL